MNSNLKDSGLRTQYETGALREPRDQQKGRFDLVPPLALLRLAQHYENGSKKYGDRNWEKGLPLSTFFDSGIRHFLQWASGDRSEDHLAAVMWNAAGAIWTERQIQDGRLPSSLNDLPNVYIGSVTDAIAAIDRAREQSPSDLAKGFAVHGFTPAASREAHEAPSSYPKRIMDAVSAKLGSWANHEPYTTIADLMLENEGLVNKVAKEAR